MPLLKAANSFWRSPSGILWDIHSWGEASPETPALVFLHGMAGTGLDAEFLTPELPAFRIISPDLPGHGGSSAPNSLDSYLRPSVLNDLDHLIHEVAPSGNSVLAGYSMGGRIALEWAVTRKPSFPVIVLATSMGIQNSLQRQKRRLSDMAWADRFSRETPESVVLSWQNQATLKACNPQTDEWKRHEERKLRTMPQGWRYPMIAWGQGTWPPYDPASNTSSNIHWIYGQQDPLLQREEQSDFVSRRSEKVHLVPDAGHCVHLDQPSHVRQLIQRLVSENGTIL